MKTNEVFTKKKKETVAKINRLLKASAEHPNALATQLAKYAKLPLWAVHEYRAFLIAVGRLSREGAGNYILVSGSDIQLEEYTSYCSKRNDKALEVIKKTLKKSNVPKKTKLLTEPMSFQGQLLESSAPEHITIAGTPQAVAEFFNRLKQL